MLQAISLAITTNTTYNYNYKTQLTTITTKITTISVNGVGQVFSMPPPSFDCNNYQVWAIKMTVYLEALDLWESVEDKLPEMPDNPTVAQLKSYKEKRTRHAKAKSCLYSAVSGSIFTRIMNLESANDI